MSATNGELKFAPSDGYHGPVTALYPRTGGYEVNHHCASCGSTDISTSFPKNSELTAIIRCKRCGRVTNIRKTQRYDTARYSILVNGDVVRDSVPRTGMEAALAAVLGDMQRYSAEKARQFYGPNYKTVVSTISHAGMVDSTFRMIAESFAFESGYVDGLEVGEEYNLPDFPVAILRVEDAYSGPTVRGNGRSGVDVEQLAEDMGYAFWETEPDDYIEQFGEYPSEEEYLMSLDALSSVGGVDEAILYVESCVDPVEFPMYDDLLARLKAYRKELTGPVASKSRKPARKKAAKPRAPRTKKPSRSASRRR